MHKPKKIALIWIAGHSNIQGNEAADKASKQTAQTNREKVQVQTYSAIKNK